MRWQPARNLAGAKGVRAAALDGAGKLTGASIQGKKTAAGWELPLGDPVTTYAISVRR